MGYPWPRQGWNTSPPLLARSGWSTPPPRVRVECGKLNQCSEKCTYKVSLENLDTETSKSIFFHIFIILWNLSELSVVVKCEKIASLVIVAPDKHNWAFLVWVVSFLWSQWYLRFGHLVTSALGFTARVEPLFVCFLACVQCIPQIHLWCHTNWPLNGQHAVEPFWSTYLWGLGSFQWIRWVCFDADLIYSSWWVTKKLYFERM